MGNINWVKLAKYAGIALLLYIIYRVISNRLESPKKPPTPVVLGSGGIPIPIPELFIYNPAKVVRDKKFGVGTNNSQEVAYLQTWLNVYYNTGLKVDGDWGTKTTAAVTVHRPLTNQISTTLQDMGI